MVFGLDDMAFATLAAGALQGGSSLFGGIMGSSGQQEINAQQLAFSRSEQNRMNDQYWQTRADNLEQARISREYANTAYQRAMADMKAAGLNPILAGSLGGANVGQSASISGGSPVGLSGLGNPGEAMQRGMSGLGNAIGHSAQVKAALTAADQAASQTELNRETTNYTKANTGLTTEATKKAVQDTSTSLANEDAARASATASRAAAAVSAAQVGLVQQQTNSAASQAQIDAAAAKDVSTYGVPRNEGIGGLLGRILRQVAPHLLEHGQATGARGVEELQRRLNAPRTPLIGGGDRSGWSRAPLPMGYP